jgi:diadenosine tetraphosphatase ApaH/serine/threonine PP2A family protein phosphatase
MTHTAPDTDVPTTPVQLLTDLGELHTRTCVSPLPKHPAAMGWQATAGSMAAGFARALHALNEVAPDKAAEVADWFDGPFGEGPDPKKHTNWLERHVVSGPAGLEQWVEEGRRAAAAAQASTVAWEKGRAA